MQLEITENCTSCQSANTKEIARQEEFGVRACQECGLLYVSPRPDAEFLKKIYEEEYFEGTSDHGNPEGYLGQATGYQARAKVMVEWISSLSGHASGGWLDIGCGPGFLVEAAAKHGFQARGIDVSSAAVDIGKRELGLELQVCEAENLRSLHQGPFAVVSLFDCLFHVRDPRQVIESAFEVLQSGGHLFAGPFDLHEANWKVPEQVAADDLRGMSIPEHLTFVNQSSMNVLLQQIGFSQIRFLPMPESPSAVAAAKLSAMPPFVVSGVRKVVRRLSFLQKAVHKAASTYVNQKAGYVLARKP